jgi:hypothetical protein
MLKNSKKQVERLMINDVYTFQRADAPKEENLLKSSITMDFIKRSQSMKTKNIRKSFNGGIIVNCDLKEVELIVLFF